MVCCNFILTPSGERHGHTGLGPLRLLAVPRA
jgi:hypothetical protein